MYVFLNYCDCIGMPKNAREKPAVYSTMPKMRCIQSCIWQRAILFYVLYAVRLKS